MVDCEIFPFVELTQFGDDRTVVIDVVKSPPASLFVVVVHPAGSEGTKTESKFSEYGNDVICAGDSVTMKKNRRSILFI